MVRTLLCSFVLFGYFSILIYTPVHMIEMVDMNMPMEHCPFAMSQHVICTMTISEHVREWQNWLQSFLPPLKVLIYSSPFFTLGYLLVAALQLLRLLLYHKRYSDIKRYSFLQKLFSQGILNTKVYRYI